MTIRFGISLTLDNVSVARLGQVIVSGVSVALAAGAAVVVRGPNGAGKTSLLRGIAGLSELVDGKMSCSDTEDLAELRSGSIHYLGHKNGVSSRMSVMEHLRFWHGLYAQQGEGPDFPALIRRLGLEGSEKSMAGRLSAGQLRRLSFARLLIAPKPIWLLDEAAAALDQDGAELLQEMIAQHRALGGIVIMTLHEGSSPPNSQILQLTRPETAFLGGLG